MKLTLDPEPGRRATACQRAPHGHKLCKAARSAPSSSGLPLQPPAAGAAQLLACSWRRGPQLPDMCPCPAWPHATCSRTRHYPIISFAGPCCPLLTADLSSWLALAGLGVPGCGAGRRVCPLACPPGTSSACIHKQGRLLASSCERSRCSRDLQRASWRHQSCMSYAGSVQATLVARQTL